MSKQTNTETVNTQATETDAAPVLIRHTANGRTSKLGFVEVIRAQLDVMVKDSLKLMRHAIDLGALIEDVKREAREQKYPGGWNAWIKANSEVVGLKKAQAENYCRLFAIGEQDILQLMAEAEIETFSVKAVLEADRAKRRPEPVPAPVVEPSEPAEPVAPEAPAVAPAEPSPQAEAQLLLNARAVISRLEADQFAELLHDIVNDRPDLLEVLERETGIMAAAKQKAA